MRLEAQFKGGYYPTPPRVVDMIADHLNPVIPGGRTSQRGNLPMVCRLLDPCCGTGAALAQMSEFISERRPGTPLETYGVELHRDRAQEAGQVLDKVLASDLFATSIANGAFSVLYLNPPYDHDQEEKRVEHAFLTHCSRYLVAGGVLVYVVPRHRLGISARYLASHYHSIRCWTFPEPECREYDQVVLMGHRQPEVVLDDHALEDIREWSTTGLVPLEFSQMRCPAPQVPEGDILFNLRTVDPETAAAAAQRSGLWVDTEVTDSLWPLEKPRIRPLMPLRRGHMAMLIAAGFMDNLSLEAPDGQRILVKGRTTKQMVLVEQTPESETFREQMQTTIISLDLDTGSITDISA